MAAQACASRAQGPFLNLVCPTRICEWPPCSRLCWALMNTFLARNCSSLRERLSGEYKCCRGGGQLGGADRYSDRPGVHEEWV